MSPFPSFAQAMCLLLPKDFRLGEDAYRFVGLPAGLVSSLPGIYRKAVSPYNNGQEIGFYGLPKPPNLLTVTGFFGEGMA